MKATPRIVTPKRTSTLPHSAAVNAIETMKMIRSPFTTNPD